jgi:hypothetical protein
VSGVRIYLLSFSPHLVKVGGINELFSMHQVKCT